MFIKDIITFADNIIIDENSDVNFQTTECINVYNLFMNRTRRSLTSEFKKACKSGNIQYIDYILDMNFKYFDKNNGLFYAVKYNNMELLEYFEKKGANNWEFVMCGANDMDIIKYIINKIETNNKKFVVNTHNFSVAFYYSLKHNNLDCISYLLPYVNIYDGLKSSIAHNNKTYMEYFINNAQSQYGDVEWPNIGLRESAKCGNKELVDYFISHGANSWHDSLIHCVKRNNHELIDFFIHKGANNRFNFECLMKTATEYNNKEIIDFCILHGATNFDKCLICAVHHCYHELVYFFMDKITKDSHDTTHLRIFGDALANADYNQDNDMIELFMSLI